MLLSLSHTEYIHSLLRVGFMLDKTIIVQPFLQAHLRFQSRKSLVLEELF
jgi:hypothetical protein